MDDLIKRLKALEAFLRGEEPLRGANFGEPNPALHKGMFWWRNYLGPMREAAAALAEAQATIARMEAERANLAFDGKTLQGWTQHDVLVNHEGAYLAIKTIADRLAALSPREGEG